MHLTVLWKVLVLSRTFGKLPLGRENKLGLFLLGKIPLGCFCSGKYPWVVSARENTLGLFLLGKTFATNLLLIYQIETTIVKKNVRNSSAEMKVFTGSVNVKLLNA